MTDKDYHPDGFSGTGVTPVEGFKTMGAGEDIAALKSGAGNTVPSGAGVEERKPMSYYEAEVLVALHNGLTFAAIRAVERAHGIV